MVMVLQGARRANEVRSVRRSMPDVPKNHSEEVTHSAVSAVNSSPPSTGMLHRGTSGRGSTSILATNRP